MFATQTRRWEVMMFLTLVALLVIAALARGGRAAPVLLPALAGSGPFRTWVEPGNGWFDGGESLERDILFVADKDVRTEEQGRPVEAQTPAVRHEDPSLSGSEAESVLVTLRAKVLRHPSEDAGPAGPVG